MRILLVRHGESQSNCDSTLHKIIPDHEISLSSLGFSQAEYAGECLKAYFEKTYADIYNNDTSIKEKAESKIDELFDAFGKDNQLKSIMKGLLSNIDGSNHYLNNELKPKIKLYHSPYRRTRETTNEILKVIKPLVCEVQEDVLLAECRHGIFDGLEDDEQEKEFPNEFKLFTKNKLHNCKFWAEFPHGESPFDVAIRLRQFFQLLKEDEENGINDVVIVCHGIVIKVFTMAWLNKTPEWYEEEQSPGNCSIRILENKKDMGYIFGGHRNGKAWNYQPNIKK